MSTEIKPRQKLPFFISYSRRDRIIVRMLFDRLEARHYRLWMDTDERGIEVGDKWRDKLIAAMSGSEAVIACVSSDFLKSPYCKQEIEQAIQENKKIYPVIVHPLADGESLAQFGLDEVQYLDLVDDFDEGFIRLTAALPEPASLRQARIRQIGMGVAVIAVIALIIFGISKLIPQPLPVTTNQVVTPLSPTATPSIANTDLKAVVAQFEPSEPMNDSQREFANQLIKRMADDVREQIELQSASSFDIGVLALDWLPAVGDKASAESLASTQDYDVVIYGTVNTDSNGGLVFTPRLYIPEENLSYAPEMTGDQPFGEPIALASVDDIAQAYQTSVALQARVQTLVAILRGIGRYSADDLQGALREFSSAQAQTIDAGEREILTYLTGNTQLQLARQAIETCVAESARERLELAEQQYQTMDLGVENGEAKHARPYIGLAEVLMLRSTWEEMPEDQCEPADADQALADRAIEFAELALDANDFFSLHNSLQANALITAARAYATRWVFQLRPETETTDFSRALNNIGDVLAIYSRHNDHLAIQRDAFEAYVLRAVLNVLGSSAYESGLNDLDSALSIPNIPPRRLTFANDYAAQFSAALGNDESAEAYYRRAYDLAPDDFNRSFYGCMIIQLTGDANATVVTGDCSEILEEAG